MTLQENHKQFAVKCYAQFMTTEQVATKFMQEFQDDLPKPPLPDQNNQNPNDIANQLEKTEYYNDWQRHYYRKYESIYKDEAEQKFQQDRPKINELIGKRYVEMLQRQSIKNNAEQTETLQDLTKQHTKTLKRKIANQIRVYNITNTRFPKKYEQLFNQTRQQYIENYGNPNTPLTDNTDTDTDILTAELQTLYAYIKQQIFQAKNPKEAAVHTRLAHTILKTIDQRTRDAK